MAKSLDKIVYKKVSKGRRRLLIIYTVVLVITCAAVFINSAYNFLKDNKTNNSQLIESVNLQMRKSFNSYLSKLENTSKIVFSKKDYISYDPTRSKNNYYNNLRKESEIEDYLVTLSLMDNYADFGIVYRNNHTIGKITDGTLDIYDGNMFYALSEYLGSGITKWVTGYNNDYSRFMYLRKANNNAIFVASFYSTDLENVLLPEKQSVDIRVMLSDSDNVVIYSDNEAELGEKLPKNIFKAISENNNCVVISDNYITGISSCGSDWKINTVLNLNRQYGRLKNTAAVAAGMVCAGLILFLLIGFISFSGKDPEMWGKTALKRSGGTDEITGLLNPENTENKIADKIETCITGSTIMLALISISNYRLIMETYGQQTVNEAAIKVKDVLYDLYGENDIIGRMSGNEFAVFADFTEYDLFKAHNKIKSSLKLLEEKLAECELDQDRGIIKSAVGAVIYPDNSSDYDELYEQAAEALSQALEKNDGKAVLLKKEEIEKGGCKL